MYKGIKLLGTFFIQLSMIIRRKRLTFICSADCLLIFPAFYRHFLFDFYQHFRCEQRYPKRLLIDSWWIKFDNKAPSSFQKTSCWHVFSIYFCCIFVTMLGMKHKTAVEIFSIRTYSLQEDNHSIISRLPTSTLKSVYVMFGMTWRNTSFSRLLSIPKILSFASLFEQISCTPAEDLLWSMLCVAFVVSIFGEHGVNSVMYFRI